MVGPRIVFTRFPSPHNPQLRRWWDHTARVTGAASGDLEPVESTGVIVWSLISANNRELARGGHVHNAYDAAVADANGVIAQGDSLEPRLTAERTRGYYGWYLASGDRIELVCSRWYESDRYRTQAMAAARSALPAAILLDGARTSGPRGSSRERVGS